MARLLAPKVAPGADDLEILYPEVLVPIGREAWRVREFTLREGFRYAEGAKQALAAHREPTATTDIKSNDKSRALIALIALNCGRPELQVASLADEPFEALVAAWVNLNREWLVEPAQPKRAGRARRWSSVFQMLVSNGHSFAAVRDYTLRQVRLFCDAIERERCRERAARIRDVNLGFAGGEGTKDTVKQLDKASE